MITASLKRKENIAEYLLYMWQIEDLIRANSLDINLIKVNVIDRYKGLDKQKAADMAGWYESLIDMMRREGVSQTGHLQMNRNVISDLESLHARLLAGPEFGDYSAAYYDALPDLVEIRAKAGENKRDEIESAFVALYGLLLLRMQGKEISPQTQAAVQRISRFIALLAAYYKKDEEGQLFKN